jgi:site-specific recombinase XerD
MSDAAERFVTWQRSYNGVSEVRCRQVARMLADLSTFVGGPAETATPRDFEGWLGAMGAEGLHPNTIRKYGNMVRPFFKWAHREGLMTAQDFFAMAEVPNPRGATGNSTPKPYTRKQIAKLWAEIDTLYPLADKFVMRWNMGRSRWPRVYRHAARLQINAIVHLCLHAGLRREEVFRLSIDAIHPDNAYIVVEGAAKGHGSREPRLREVPMTAELRRALSEWLELRALCGCKHDRPWLVLNPRANPNGIIPSHPFDAMSFGTFRSLLTNLGSGWSFHRLRHTYATELLRAGMPLENLRELLGHARLQQTLAYAKIVPQDNERHMRRVEESFSRALGREVAA